MKNNEKQMSQVNPPARIITTTARSRKTIHGKNEKKLNSETKIFFFNLI